MILTILFPENTDIHYIGGADVLPAPLELEEENRTIMALGTADEESAVFIGRCADYVLRDSYPTLRVFIYAPLDCRIARISERNSISAAEAKSLIEKTDKRRAN